MSKRNKADRNGFVFSTDPTFRFEPEDVPQHETIEPGKQQLRVKLDNKQRGGKMVTLVSGFIGTENDLDQLGKQVKQFCGTGGAVKDGEVIIQGDQREKVMTFLLKNGYSKSKKV
ncbi:translation initiation factor [Flavihumibacter solisilvae]|jgi:translation initiation factor 1|uniref:SUI1 domain-containing protein n=1 Tax=Flavihumibacter solisilvae TaxID=1349421 RepID=A0A0C1LGY7_9BACT|nr:translation initiation factor [Flavihumibacter solisilvae]KIC94568.1 hypothetical protein OI18_10675 [Flavihumibacter solisilvae]